MRRITLYPTLGLLFIAACGAAAARGADDRIVETRTLRESVPLHGDAPCTVRVENVFGAVRVVGHESPVVEVVAEETVRARSAEALERARREVWLDVGAEGDEVRVIVDGEFRRHEERHGWGGEWDGYRVQYDFEIRVPRGTHLDLRTVNDGVIGVHDVHGRFHAANVNGPVTLTGVTGPGEATTVNGAVQVHFDENPDGDSTFHTVNGKLELWFQPGLSADLRFKTFHGEARTDFDVTPLASDPPAETLHDGRRIIRTPDWSAVRVDRGGPQLSFETLNGDILIRKARD